MSCTAWISLLSCTWKVQASPVHDQQRGTQSAPSPFLPSNPHKGTLSGR